MFESLVSTSGLSLERLRGFLEFAEVGSIAKAAEGELSRQALISRQIRELEEFFGTELTFRRGKSLSLSPAGKRLAQLIRGQFQDLSDFQLEQKQLARSFSLGAGASILEWLVVPAAAKIRSALRNSTLRLSPQRSQDLVDHIRDGRLDFAVVRGDAVADGLPRIPIADVKFHICVSRKIVGRQSKSRLDDFQFLQRLPFSATAGGGQLDKTFRQAMIDRYSSFSPAYECDSLLQVRELVVHGACAGLLPSIGIKGLDEGEIVTREFEPMKHYGRGLVLHWNERQMRRRGLEEPVLSEIAQAMMKTLKQKPMPRDDGRTAWD